MAEIKVTPKELETKAGNLTTLNSQFRKAVEEMVSYVSKLNGMWEGQAKDAFNKAFDTDKGKMEAFAGVIDQYAQKLTAIATEYKDAEQMAYSLASQRSV